MLCSRFALAFTISCASIVTTSSAATAAESNYASPVAIQKVDCDASRHVVVMTFNDRKKYDPSLLDIYVEFFEKGPNGFVLIEQTPSIDLTRWEHKNTKHQVRISQLRAFAQLKITIQYSSEEVESKSFDPNGEQVGAAQPATAPESKPESNDKPQPESKPAPR